jgi:predicted alpha/beta-hydrolase family hydrolase
MPVDPSSGHSGSWVANEPGCWNRDAGIILAHGAGQGMESPFMSFFNTAMSERGYLSVKFNFDYMNRTDPRSFDDSDENLRIDTFRTQDDESLSGKQSGVRIIHVPTGLAVSSESEDSQLRNRVKALSELRAHLDVLRTKKSRGAPDSQPKLQAAYSRVIDEVRQTYRPKRLFIGGKSMGGRVASYIAGTAEGVAGLVFLGYPLHPPAKPDQMRDKHLYELNVPMLFISGTKDTFARRDLLEAVVGRIGQRATLKWIEGGNHSLAARKGGAETLNEAADTIQGWIESL